MIMEGISKYTKTREIYCIQMGIRLAIQDFIQLLLEIRSSYSKVSTSSSVMKSA
jgi:hypothetical protein